jgi:hypothetical protein
MSLSEEIKKVKKELEDLKKNFNDLGKASIDRTIRSLESGTSTLEDWNYELNNFQDQADKVSSTLDYVASSFKDSVNELSRQNVYLKSSKDILSDLAKKANEVLSMRRGETSINEKLVKDAKDKVALQERELRTNLARLNANSREAQEIRESIQALGDYKQALDDVLETNKNINKQLGATPQIAAGLEKTLSKIGLPDLGVADALDKTRKLGQEAARGGKEFNAMSTFTKAVGTNLKGAFSTANILQFTILQIVNALKITDQEAGNLAKSMNITYSEALNTRRELGNMAAMSGDVALNTKNLQESYVAIGKSLGSNAMASEKTLITFTKLREQAGYTNEQLAELNKLSLVNGKSLEQNTKEILGGAQAYASRKGLVLNEKEILNDVVTASASLKLSLGGSSDALAKAAVQARAVGINLETAASMAQQLLQFESSIESELSAELLLGKDLNFEKARQLALNNDIAGAAEEIANQVGSSADFAKMNAIQQEAIAKAAGMTKDQLAQSLMDREALAKLSGVEGKDAKEKFDNLVKQVGLEEAKKRLGNDQLANQYAQQSVQERFTQAVEKLKELFIQVAEPILAIVSPLMNIVTSILPLVNILLKPIVWAFQTIGDIVSGIFNWLSESKGVLVTLVSLATGLMAAMKGAAIWAGIKKGYDQASLVFTQRGLILEQGKAVVQGIQLGYQAAMGSYAAKRAIVEKGGLLRSIGEASMKVISSLASIPIVGWALGLAAAGTVAALGYSFMKGNDVFSKGMGSNGYGKRTLFGPEGAIQFNDRDNIIATTNEIKPANDYASVNKISPESKSTAKETTIVTKNSTAPKKELDYNALILEEQRKQTELAKERNVIAKKDNSIATLKMN